MLPRIFSPQCSRKQWLNPGLSDDEIKLHLDGLVQASKNDDLGREFYKKITASSGVRFFDFNNPKNNLWHCTTEFSCENPDTHDSFRPDITCFVNGLPLAFIEVKKPNNHEGILAERDRINKRFKVTPFRQFLNVTQLMIFSNNQEMSFLFKVRFTQLYQKSGRSSMSSERKARTFCERPTTMMRLTMMCKRPF